MSFHGYYTIYRVRQGRVSVSLFNGISTFVGYSNAKSILLEEEKCCYLTHRWQDKGVHTFPKGICPKVNAIVWLELELAYYDSAMRTPSSI